MHHFYFGQTKFTILHGKDKSRWLIGRELCDFLKLNNISNALSKLPDDCKKKIVIEAFKSKGRGGDNGVRIIVNREGVNRLIVQSTRPEADRFTKWLLGKVYGEIEDNGIYSHPGYQPKIEKTDHTAGNFHIPENLTVRGALLLALDRETAREKACEERDIEIEKNVIARKTVQQTTKKVNYLENIIPPLQRKAASYDQRFNTIGNFTFNGAAKNMGQSPHAFNNELRAAGILFATHDYVMPKQKYVEIGWFVVKERSTIHDETKKVLQAYITPLGMYEIWERIYAPKMDVIPTPWKGQKHLFDGSGND